MGTSEPSTPSIHEAVEFILFRLRLGDTLSELNADLVVGRACREWLKEHGFTYHPLNDGWMDIVAPAFFDAAWSLVRRGILRPGAQGYRDQAGNSLERFSLTLAGCDFVENHDGIAAVLLDASALSSALDRFASRFGASFAIRAREAVTCLHSDCFYAACAMAGAAAESILLRIGEQKFGEEDLQKLYKGASSRKRLQDAIAGKSSQRIQRALSAGLSIISYWRDDSAHGERDYIEQPEAELALRELLGLATFAEKEWDELVAK